MTGAVNAGRRDHGKAALFPPGYHRTAGYIFSAMLVVIFAWWAVETFSLRSNILYSVHGLLGLCAAILASLGLVSGVLLRRSEEARGPHWFLTIVGYGFSLFMILTGIFLAF